MQLSLVLMTHYLCFLLTAIAIGKLTDSVVCPFLPPPLPPSLPSSLLVRISLSYWFHMQGPQWFLCIGPFIAAVGYFFIGPIPSISQRYILLYNAHKELNPSVPQYTVHKPLLFIQCSHLWLTVTSYGVIGVGAATSITPVFANMLRLARWTWETETSVHRCLPPTWLHTACRAADSVTQVETLNSLISGAIHATMAFGWITLPYLKLWCL